MKSFGNMCEWMMVLGLFVILSVHSVVGPNPTDNYPSENDFLIAIEETQTLFNRLDLFIRPEAATSSEKFRKCLGFDFIKDSGRSSSQLKEVSDILSEVKPSFNRIDQCAIIVYVKYFNHRLNNAKPEEKLLVYEYFNIFRNNTLKDLSPKDIPLLVTFINVVRRYDDALMSWRVLLIEIQYFFDKMNTFIEVGPSGRLAVIFEKCTSDKGISKGNIAPPDQIRIINDCTVATYTSTIHDSLLGIIAEERNQTDEQGNLIDDQENPIDTSKLHKIYDMWYDYRLLWDTLKVEPTSLLDRAVEIFQKCHEKNKKFLPRYVEEVYLAKYWNVTQF